MMRYILSVILLVNVGYMSGNHEGKVRHRGKRTDQIVGSLHRRASSSPAFGASVSEMQLLLPKGSSQRRPVLGVPPQLSMSINSRDGDAALSQAPFLADDAVLDEDPDDDAVLDLDPLLGEEGYQIQRKRHCCVRCMTCLCECNRRYGTKCCGQCRDCALTGAGLSCIVFCVKFVQSGILEKISHAMSGAGQSGGLVSTLTQSFFRR